MLISQQVLAQVADDFSDGDFAFAAAWSGDDPKFVVLNNQLKLQAPAATGTAYLSTPCQAINDASWEFFVKMDFNPSSGNYTRVYLTSDNTDLSGALNGYYVLVGDTPDEVSLYKQTGDIRTKIIDGLNGRVNLSVVNVKIKVTRDVLGNWTLFSDVDLTGTYTLEGSVVDDTHLISSSFGIYCVYTSTRSTRFYFDDFVVTGNPFADIISPELQQITIVSSQEIEVTFSEELDETSAKELTNYSVSPGIGNPVEADLYGDKKTVLLKFNGSFPNGIACMLTVSEVKDIAGNEIAPTQKEFAFFQPVRAAWRDIIISEIFPDPSPRINLPDAEFVEILNRSTNIFNLADWAITDGGSDAKLPAAFLQPGEYLIITTTADAATFSGFGNTIGVSNFPTLNNSGDALVLEDQYGAVIDSINYSDSWYHDDDKRAGGWSLERIDPANICAESENWTSSDDPGGGTPGKENSVFANKPDLIGPKLISVVPVSSSTLILNFNEKLENAIPPANSFVLQPAISVSSVKLSNASLYAIELSLEENLVPGISYSIQVDKVFDCAGNEIQNIFNKLEFGLPEAATSLNVLINEILFNPTPTGTDFVEIYNYSNKYLNLKNWSLANVEDGVIVNSKAIVSTDFLLKPGSYLVLSENSNIVKAEYPSSIQKNFLQVTDLPSMNDDAGTIALLDDQGKLIDEFEYSDDLHSSFLDDDEGVSLERISFRTQTSDPQNWKSASSQSGFATPGYINSIARQDGVNNASVLRIEPEIFTPLGGQQDFVQIIYTFDQGGFVGNVKIVDTQGRCIKGIANNELLGTEGFFRWDGDTSDGSKARVGYYMVWFEIFDATGFTQVLKRRVAIAGRF